MKTKELINENVGLQCSISQVISDLVDARLHKDSHKEAECISRMETLLVGIEQHLQCTEGFLKESKSVEPKFKVGDKIVKKNGISVPVEITSVGDEFYYSNTYNGVGVLPIKDQDDWELVSDDFEPKFKIGDRIKYIYYDRKVAKIIKIYDDKYELDNGNFIYFQDENAYEISNDKFDISSLKPFDKVLVRDTDTRVWVISFYGFCDELNRYKYSCTDGYRYMQCIQFEGNEHLLGTTNDCDEYYKNWEYDGRRS